RDSLDDGAPPAPRQVAVDHRTGDGAEAEHEDAGQWVVQQQLAHAEQRPVHEHAPRDPVDQVGEAIGRRADVRSPRRDGPPTETTKAVIIADTSLQALIRHQYQRNSSTAPVPAPVMINSFQAPPIDSMRKATAAEITVSSAVASRDART